MNALLFNPQQITRPNKWKKKKAHKDYQAQRLYRWLLHCCPRATRWLGVAQAYNSKSQFLIFISLQQQEANSAAKGSMPVCIRQLIWIGKLVFISLFGIMKMLSAIWLSKAMEIWCVIHVCTRAAFLRYRCCRVDSLRASSFLRQKLYSIAMWRWQLEDCRFSRRTTWWFWVTSLPEPWVLHRTPASASGFISAMV